MPKAWLLGRSAALQEKSISNRWSLSGTQYYLVRRSQMTPDSQQNKKPLHPAQARQRQELAKEKIKAEIEALGVEADQASDGDTRRTLVDRIASLTVEYQAED
jgi:hypothetical protein